jgi:hypothetical protein
MRLADPIRLPSIIVEIRGSAEAGASEVESTAAGSVSAERESPDRPHAPVSAAAITRGAWSCTRWVMDTSNRL